MKKTILKIINAISVVIICVALYAMIKVVFTPGGTAPEFLGYSVFRISSGSMEPTIKVDSLVVVKQIEPQDVQVDDVITFYSDDPVLQGFPNTHRVKEIIDEDGHLYYVTQGDANPIVDAYKADSSKLIGVVIYQSPLFGKAMRLLSNPLIFIPVIALPLVYILISSIIDTIRIAGKISEEEDNSDV